jgi:hypothetical protein
VQDIKEEESCDGCHVLGTMLLAVGKFKLCAGCIGTPYTSIYYNRIQQNLSAKQSQLRNDK